MRLKELKYISTFRVFEDALEASLNKKGNLNAIKGAEIYQYIYIMLKDGLLASLSVPER